MTDHPIGTAKGPGETAHEFTLITPDREQKVKTGEFVADDGTPLIAYEKRVGEA